MLSQNYTKAKERKMKRFFAILIILSTLLTLNACNKKDDGIPDGMQLVRGGEKYGYYMYAPEEWTVASYGEVSSAYASNVDTSSISYVEVPMPSGTVDEYFRESLREFPKQPEIKTANADTTFGNADEAKKYVFEHEYSGHRFRTMQIFVRYGERFGIFTFNAVLENVSSPDAVQYDYYEEKIASVIKNFKFVAKTGEEEKNSYPADSDGYKLVSDKSVVKYSLYLPEEFEVDFASGMTVATLADGSNLTLSRATTTGIKVNEYWETRKEELSSIVTEIKELNVEAAAKLGNSKQAVAYEYTFVYNNTKYHVYQILAVTTFNGFVLTYTATEDNYTKHIDTIMKIAEKVEF